MIGRDLMASFVDLEPVEVLDRLVEAVLLAVDRVRLELLPLELAAGDGLNGVVAANVVADEVC